MLITEYDLPRKTIEPHDVIVDARGQVWYSNFGEMFLGKLDPNTGKASEIPLPEYKKGYPTGTLDIEFDKTGNIWLGMMYQAQRDKFDPKTEKFQFWQVPQGRNRDRLAAQHGHDEFRRRWQALGQRRRALDHLPYRSCR